MVDPTALTNRILELDPNVVSKSECTSDDFCPYRLRLSFSRLGCDSAVEILVICRTIAEGLELSSHFVTPGASAIAEIQPLVVQEFLSFEEKQSAIDEWARRLCDSLVSRAEMIVAILFKNPDRK
jgi:hypothetical protein